MQVQTPTDTIDDDLIPFGSAVVFDWDNTLKVINKKERRIESRVTAAFLENLIKVKRCRLYIISAISPSRINMDTLLMEVDRLGIREFFCRKCQQQLLSSHDVEECTYECSFDEEEGAEKCGNVKSAGISLKKGCPHVNKVETVNEKYCYVHWENIVISGYDKAEVFLELMRKENENLRDNEKPGSFGMFEEECSRKSRNFSHSQGYDQADGPMVSELENDLTKDYDQVDSSMVTLSKNSFSRQVIFFDDEEINIHNFSKLIENSRCYLVQ